MFSLLYPGETRIELLSSVPQYIGTRAQLDQLISRINARFTPAVGWKIVYLATPALPDILTPMSINQVRFGLTRAASTRVRMPKTNRKNIIRWEYGQPETSTWIWNMNIALRNLGEEAGNCRLDYYLHNPRDNSDDVELAPNLHLVANAEFLQRFKALSKMGGLGAKKHKAIDDVWANL